MEKDKKIINRVRVKKITVKPNADVYDITVTKNHNFFVNNILVHNCFEVGFIPVTEDGICGVQYCNLTSINGAKIRCKEDFLESVKASSIIGTLQAGYTYFPYLSKIAEKLTNDEALLGCSITGMMDSPEILLNPDIQKEGAELSKKINKEWSNKINIKSAARVCVLKPEGTSSLILGTSSGIHPHHSKKYFRRVQSNKIDPVYKFFKRSNFVLCEHSVWSENNTDDVITFPIEVNNGAIIKSDLTAIRHLEYIKSTQQNWILNGISENNKKNVTHNVSCTVAVKENEWQDVINYLYENRNYFAAVSLVPYGSDKIYPQSPNEEITTEEDENLWKKIIENFKHVDYTQLKEEDDNTNLVQEGSCYGGICELKI